MEKIREKKLFWLFVNKKKKKVIILLGTVIPDKTSSNKSKLDQNQAINQKTGTLAN